MDVTNTQAYAQALREAYEKNFGGGPEKEAHRFSWEKVTHTYLELIDKVIKQK